MAVHALDGGHRNGSPDRLLERPPVKLLGNRNPLGDRFPLCALIDPKLDRFYLIQRELAVHRHPRAFEPGDAAVQSAALRLARHEDNTVLSAFQRRLARVQIELR